MMDHADTQNTQPDSRAAHTPGPWVESEMSDWFADRYEGRGSFSWTVIRSDSADVDVAIVAHAGRDDDPILEANARLIAAAPELLSAVRWLRAFWLPGSNHDTQEVQHALAAADAAIDKATK